MKTLLSLLLGTWLFMGWTASAWACCESALSCGAAVASAGAIYVVDAALSALQVARGQLEKDRTGRQREFDEALSLLDKEPTAVVSQAQQSAEEALRSVLQEARAGYWSDRTLFAAMESRINAESHERSAVDEGGGVSAGHRLPEAKAVTNGTKALRTGGK
jgi:hypothetical protein